MPVAQQEVLCAWLEDHFCRSTVEIRAYVTAQFDLRHAHSGCVKLLARLGFEYRKPKTLPRVVDVAKQAEFFGGCLSSTARDTRQKMVNKDHKLSVRRQCVLLTLVRSNLYYGPKGESAEKSAVYGHHR